MEFLQLKNKSNAHLEHAIDKKITHLALNYMPSSQKLHLVSLLHLSQGMWPYFLQTILAVRLVQLDEESYTLINNHKTQRLSFQGSELAYICQTF